MSARKAVKRTTLAPPERQEVSEPYRLAFMIPGLPDPTNRKRVHWTRLMRDARRWKGQVILAVPMKLRPQEPLKFVRMKLTRHSSSQPDFDGLVSSWKHVIDGLIEADILENDRPANFENGKPDYRWAKAAPKKGHITIEIEEVKP